jgi:Protein of unknown function (DUF3105)
VANTSDRGGQRPTKAERIQQQMASKRRNRNIGLVLIALAAVVVVVVVFVLQPGSSHSNIPSTSELLSSAAAEAKTSGCGPVTTTKNFQNAPGADPAIDHAHIGTPPVTSPPPLSQYPTDPPASGPHEPTPLPAGVYNRPPDIYASIHSLEHAGATIWYAPAAANSDAVKQIKAFYSQKANVGQAKVIVAPYDYSSQGITGSLPSGVQMALVAWHRLQTCAEPSLAVAFNFTSQYSNGLPGAKYQGVAREPTLPL